MHFYDPIRGTWYQIGTYNHFIVEKSSDQLGIYISVNAIKTFNSDVISRFQNMQLAIHMYKRYLLDC